jgi:hypothetical protein
MRGEVTILVDNTPAGLSESYTVNINSAPNPGAFNCETGRIDISALSYDFPDSAFTTAASQGAELYFYDCNGVLLGTLIITAFTSYLYFDIPPFGNCDKIADDACYFTFTTLGESTGKTYLDLYPNEVISQNWEFTEISTFTARAPFSREFRIPLTEVNAKVFNAVQITTYSGIDFYNNKLNATIFVDDVPVISGFIRLIRSIVQAGIRTDLELSFYGNAPSLFNLIGTKKLKDILALPSLNINFNIGDVNSPPTPEVTYAMIDRGTNNGLNINYLTTQLPYATQFTPCVNWGWILRNIIKDAGYDLQAVDLLAELDTIWMPWLNDTPFVLSQNVGGALIIKETTGTVPLTNGNTRFSTPSNGFIAAIDPLNWWLPNPTVFYPVAGWGPNSPIGTVPLGTYDMSAWCTFDYPYNTATTITISILLIPYTNALPVQEFIVTTIAIQANTPGTYFIGGNIVIPLTTGAAINGGLKFNMSLKSSAGFGGASTVNIYAGDPDQAFIGSGFSVNKRLAGVSDSWLFDFPANAPDATQLQFLQDVLNMFNCAIVQDSLIENKIKITPMANYLGSGITDDWSDYLAYDKDIVIKSTTDFLKNKLNFTYSAGADNGNKYYVDNAQRVYGNYEVTGYTANPNDTANEFAIGSQEIKLTTQSTPCQNFPGTTIVLPRFINDSNEYVAPGMRALYLADQYTITWTGLNPGTAEVRLLSHYSTIPADAPDKDLNWAPEAPLHYILSNPVNNLFNRYWRNYLNELYSPQARIMEAYFNLELGDILNFDFSNKYFINDCYWRVLKISDYKIGASELTRVTLIKILNLNLSECNLEIDRSLPDGSYTWTFNGDPANGTLACCNNVGGRWDALTEKCYGRPDNGGSGRNNPIAPPVLPNGTLPLNSLTKTENYNGGLDTVYQVAVGKDITDLGSDYSIMVGRDLQTDITPDSVITGRNALVKNTGQHFGGGYRAGVGNPGTMQSGTIILSNTNVFNFNGDQVVLTIGNDTITHIDLPNNTQWLVTIDLIATDLAGFWIYSKTSTSFLDVAGTGAATPVNIITVDDSGAGALNILPVIDTASTPGLFKIWAQVNTVGAFTYPTPAVLITATVNYTQAR